MGLNLQAANTVINVDLPWNPAVLEQRISRVHRMGQKRPVQAFLLVTEETLEEKLLGTLSAKHELALAALDPDSKVKAVDMVSGIEELKRRLEVLLGTKPDGASRRKSESGGGERGGEVGPQRKDGRCRRPIDRSCLCFYGRDVFPKRRDGARHPDAGNGQDSVFPIAWKRMKKAD